MDKQSTLYQLMVMDLCQYFGQKKLKDYAAFLSCSSSFAAQAIFKRLARMYKLFNFFCPHLYTNTTELNK